MKRVAVQLVAFAMLAGVGCGGVEPQDEVDESEQGLTECSTTFRPSLTSLAAAGEGVSGVNQWLLKTSTGVSCSGTADLALWDATHAVSSRSWFMNFSSTGTNVINVGFSGANPRPAFTAAQVPHPFFGKFCFLPRNSSTWICRSSPAYR